MRPVRTTDASHPVSPARRVPRFVALPVIAGVALYLLQGVPQLAGRAGGTPPTQTYWSDPWWILADVVYAGTLALGLYVRRHRRINADYSIFVALSAALTYTATGALGAAIGYNYGDPAMAFFLMFGVNIGGNWTFWIAFVLGLICLGVGARRGRPKIRVPRPSA